MASRRMADREALREKWPDFQRPGELLWWLDTRASPRKLRHFACACCQRIRPCFSREPVVQALLTAEQFADGRADVRELRQGLAALRKARSMMPLGTRWEWALTAAMEACTEKLSVWSAQQAARAAVWAKALMTLPADRLPTADSEVVLPDEERAQCDLLRDLFHPSCPRTADLLWLAWHGGTVPKMAEAIYEERRFDDLPYLADALEEAGCADAAMLDHCRGGSEHVRGCWVVDLLLGKE